MDSPDSSSRLTALAIGLLVLLAPALIIFLTLSFLTYTGDVLVSSLTLVEFVELYLIDLVLFAAFAYGLYRLTLALVQRQLPASLDALERSDTGETGDDATDDSPQN